MPRMPEHCLPSFDALARDAVRRALAHALAARSEAAAPLLLLDATAGNGHDTLFLASAATACPPQGRPRVLAFDVQPQALENTRARLAEAGIPCAAEAALWPHAFASPPLPGEPCVHLVLAGHERLADALPAIRGRVCAGLFNLGFLPGSDKRIITRPQTTLRALGGALDLLAPHGVLALRLYTGHAGGREEAEAVLAVAAALPRREWRVLALCQHNKPDAGEWLVLVERLALMSSTSDRD